MEMASSFPRIIGDVDITVVDFVTPYPADEMRNGISHRIYVPWCASDRLGQHLAMHIVNAGGQISRFPHRRRKRRTDQSLRLLLDDRNQAVPHDLVRDV
jgi:hypothetical protein